MRNFIGLDRAVIGLLVVALTRVMLGHFTPIPTFPVGQ